MDEGRLTRRDLGLGALAASLPTFGLQAAAQGVGPTAIDLLITGPDVVTYNDANTVLTDGAIAVTGNSIAWIGKADEAARLFTARETLRAPGLLAMPGFTDTHTHAAQQFLRNIRWMPSRKTGPAWKRYLIPFESVLDPDDVYYSALSAYMSMISVGTTCFLEAGGPHPDSMGRAADEVGIRGRISHNATDMDDELPPSHLWSTNRLLREGEALVRRWERHPRVNGCLSLRQMLVNTERLRIESSRLARSLNCHLHTHLSEGIYEINYSVERYNMRPPAYFASIGIFDEYLHCAHSTYLNDADLDLYAEHDVSVAHCAFGNYSRAPHRMYDMVRKNIRVGLGTDGPHRGTLDMFQVAHYAVLGQTIVEGTPYHADPPISYPDMIRYAVRNGAKAARLGDKTGALEVGKLADIVLVARGDVDQFPGPDPLIVLGQNVVGTHVRTVIVDGRPVMVDRQFRTLDAPRLRAEMARRYPVIIERFRREIS